MSPRTEEQFEEIRGSRKKEIMQTALALFANQGFHATSISSIANKAEISKGLLYNYFSGKDDLLKAIMEEGIQQITGPFDPNRDGILTENEFIFYVEEIFDIMNRDAVFFKLYFSLLMQPGVFDKYIDKMKDALAVFSKLLVPFFKEKGIEEPEEEVIFFGALLDGLGFYYINEPDYFPLEQMKKRIYRLYQVNPEGR